MPMVKHFMRRILHVLATVAVVLAVVTVAGMDKSSSSKPAKGQTFCVLNGLNYSPGALVVQQGKYIKCSEKGKWMVSKQPGAGKK